LCLPGSRNYGGAKTDKACRQFYSTTIFFHFVLVYFFFSIFKHTDADHPDHPGCSQALKLVHDILVQLNCREREALENGQREATLRELENVIEGISDLVSSERTFLSFELVSMPSGQAGRKERGFFLFNDLLVISSIKKRSGTYRKPNR
jgi:Rho guanine nucleotide exchange factor 17